MVFLGPIYVPTTSRHWCPGTVLDMRSLGWLAEVRGGFPKRTSRKRIRSKLRIKDNHRIGRDVCTYIYTYISHDSASAHERYISAPYNPCHSGLPEPCGSIRPKNSTQYGLWAQKPQNMSPCSLRGILTVALLHARVSDFLERGYIELHRSRLRVPGVTTWARVNAPLQRRLCRSYCRGSPACIKLQERRFDHGSDMVEASTVAPKACTPFL